MTPEQLRASILQYAIQGKLVEQRNDEGTADELYQKIKTEKQKLVKKGKIKKEKLREEITYEEMPFHIPDTWKWVYLGEIASINGGFAFKSSSFTPKGVRVVRISDFSNDGFVDSNIVRHPYSDELETYLLKEKDILLCMTGGTVGKSFFINHLPEKMVTNQRVATIKSYCNIQEYIYYVILSPITQSVIRQSKNSTNDNISMGTINRFLIPLPPENEICRIVQRIKESLGIVECYADAYEKLEQLNENFPEDMKQSILQDAVQGKLVKQSENDEPASILLEEITKEKKRLINEGLIKRDNKYSIIYKKDNSYYEKIGDVEKCIDEEIPFNIPQNWAWARACSLGTMIRGKGIKRADVVENGKPCVRYGEIYTSYNYSFVNTKSHISDELFEKCICFSENDVIFTLTGENKTDIAKTVAYLGKNKVAAGGDLAFWTFHGMNPLYLAFCMASPYCIEKKRELATGDIIVHISTSKVGSFLIPIPPLDEQKRIVERVKELFNYCEKL